MKISRIDKIAADWKEEKIKADTLRAHLETAEKVIKTTERERDYYKHALENLLSSTEEWANSYVPTNQSLDFIKQISRHIKKKLKEHELNTN